MAATFLGANSSKRSVVLDLKQSLGRKALFALLEQSDVLLCSVRPQKMRALGLDLEGLRDRFPRLVVVAIVGFGDQGPYAGRLAYDDIIQGLNSKGRRNRSCWTACARVAIGFDQSWTSSSLGALAPSLRSFVHVLQKCATKRLRRVEAIFDAEGDMNKPMLEIVARLETIRISRSTEGQQRCVSL
jgi:hypothetical protein